MKRWSLVFWIATFFGVWGMACSSGGGSQFTATPGQAEGGADGTVPSPFQGDGGDGGSGGCIPLTCAKLGYDCGKTGDGCGGMIDCGACTAPSSCGGSGKFSVCGGNTGCVPETCAQQGFDCGPAGDGCGGQLSCGSCAAPAFCGGAGPSVCGGGFSPPDGGLDGGACVPRTCASQGIGCGPAGDGCGNLLQCGTCNAPLTCGGGGQASQCGGNNSCVPRTCAQQGLNCGPAGDGCGGQLDCGTCTAPAFCGGGGPSVCGNGQVATDAGVYVTCDGGGVTSISGVVVAGTEAAFGTPDPIYNAYVYIPSGPVQPITTGATCDQCTAPQHSVATAITGIDGSFTLLNPPVGPNVPLVIQLGKWRRVLSVNVQACQANVLSTSVTRLPRNRTEGNIPRFAIDTGNVDVLECVLRKMGIQDTEFTDPSLDAQGIPQSPGRVHVYQATPPTTPAPIGGGAVIDSATPKEAALFGSQATLNSYDIVLFPCEGGQDDELAASQSRVISYTNAGGRVFATHFSYVWLYDDAPFSSTANWTINSASNDGPLTGIIDQSFPKGQALAAWLFQPAVGASSTLGQIPVNVVRYDFASATAPSQRWMYTQAPDPVGPIHYTFNTPVGAAPAQQCGRVVFSDFHVEEYLPGSQNKIFPTECTPDAPLTPQEKLLEFMLFDLTSCIQQDVPTCTPKTCGDLGVSCGPAGDGCGKLLQCGTCSGCEVCGGGGQSGVCGGQCCQPKTCAALGISCGPAGDGCGGQLDCGSCPNGQSCGGGGQNGQCGAIDAGVCTPTTCASQNIACGPAGDGCGNLLQCGTCPNGQTCGGGGVSGQCGAPKCVPKTCQDFGYNCGKTGDGCGAEIDCGTCTPPQTCGGAGTPGLCGGGTK